MAMSSLLSYTSNPARPVPFLGSTVGDISSRKGIQKGIDTQLQALGSQAGTAAGQRTEGYGTLAGPEGYRGLLSSGYSPLEKSSISRSTLGGINEAYGGAEDAMRRRRAATGNTAGYGSVLRSLTRGRAGAIANQTLANQSAFADEQLKRKMLGLEGIANLYGVDTSFLNSILGQQGSLLNTAAGVYSNIKATQGQGWFSKFMGGLGSGLGGGIGAGLGGLFNKKGTNTPGGG